MPFKGFFFMGSFLFEHKKAPSGVRGGGRQNMLILVNKQGGDTLFGEKRAVCLITMLDKE